MVEHHDLHHEFPEYHDAIHDLKVSNSHFAKLFDQYHDVDREVRRMEEDVEPATDDAMEEAKKKRLHLKDTLYRMLREHAGA